MLWRWWCSFFIMMDDDDRIERDFDPAVQRSGARDSTPKCISVTSTADDMGFLLGGEAEKTGVKAITLRRSTHGIQ